jgi:hypothetical protein
MNNLIKQLEKNGYEVKFFERAADVREALLNEISVDKSIGIGGSMTIQSIGIYEELLNRGNKVYWHWKAENKKETSELAKNADVYLTSSNAITMDGKLVNMDGTGNRVSSMIFGHEKVYFVIGKNKICKNYEEAKIRIETIAAPKNAERLKLNTPCRFTGRCNDCDSKDRMCNVEVVLRKKPNGSNISIYLVNEDLGY